MKQQILVYGKCGGYVTIATFLGNQWWVTNKDEKLEPLYDDGPYSEHDYRYLCEVGELVRGRHQGGAEQPPEGVEHDGREVCVFGSVPEPRRPCVQ